jgi:exodeoxyribonuclease VII large subunit
MNQPNSENMPAPTNAASNVPEFSVSDLALSLKRTIEDGFAHVRVRGELSRVSIAASGHMYSSLKDDNAVIDAVCWKGTMSRLNIRPEEGLEVICTGRISTYPQRSNYQLIIESMELAGEGALLKMLEERKKKLAAEGLFAAERKQKLPFLPEVIGIVTSPTGAVIRDILHRLRDRMPRHVIIWPALVQGDGAAAQITAGIKGLQTLGEHGLPQPDLIIVARGGGSLEDLMPFNDENVVRAAAACTIPLISAVGHETDITLIDYAADLRAPTPTGAAEMAAPVRSQLMAQILEGQQRLLGGMTRRLHNLQNTLSIQEKSLGRPETLLEIKTQQIDSAADRLGHSAQTQLARKSQRALEIGSRLRHPRDLLNDKAIRLERWSDQIKITPAKILDKAQTRLNHAGQMLEAYSFQNVLKRGYTVIRDENGKLVTRADQTQSGQTVQIEFYEQKTAEATITGSNDQN